MSEIPSIDLLRRTIVADVATRLPHLRECRPHPGRFDLAELRRLSATTPSVLVATLGMVAAEELSTGERGLELAMAAFVVTSDQRQLLKDVAALNIVEALALHLPFQRWGLPWAFPATAVQAENFYSGDVDRAAVAFWAVSWRQKVRLGTRWDDGPDGVLPTSLYVGFTPEIGIPHEDDYWQIGVE
ncbi:hypothetical protein [Chrysiogenes arsenatis]|uniref:hypothetical protein n=1 Tax=Chrysiogenes arsenatis TaxID=309797 RepID=UPI000418F4BA|nr:hypothetical protein [Chrysiogenes arsenatis]